MTSEAVGHVPPGVRSAAEAAGLSSEAVGRSHTTEPLLPLAGASAVSLGTPAAVCSLDDGCITCGDVAVALTVVEVGDYDALCRDEDGREEVVATELVSALAPGDQVLVHAKVALEKLGPPGEDSHAFR